MDNTTEIDGIISVRLTRRAQDIPEFELAQALECVIMLRPSTHPQPRYITRELVDAMRASGWQGLERIPTNCILESKAPARP